MIKLIRFDKGGAWLDININTWAVWLLMSRHATMWTWICLCVCVIHDISYYSLSTAPMKMKHSWYNTLRPRQVGRHFPDDIFKYIFLNENAWILIKISLKFVPKASIDNIPALVQIMAWQWPGDKPLSEPMMVRLLTHLCVSRPQWVKGGKVAKNTEIFISNKLISSLLWY